MENIFPNLTLYDLGLFYKIVRRVSKCTLIAQNNESSNDTDNQSCSNN